MATRLATGIAAIDKALQGGLPIGVGVALQSPSDSVSLRVGLAFLAAGLKSGSGGLLVVSSQSPEWVLSELQALGVDLEDVIAGSRLRIISLWRKPEDIPSPAVGEERTDLIDPTKLQVALSHAIAVVRAAGTRRAVIEAISPIHRAFGPRSALVFAQTAKRKFERLQVTSLFLLDKDRHSSSELAALLQPFDGEIDIERSTQGEEVKYRAAVVSMRDASPDSVFCDLDLSSPIPIPEGETTGGDRDARHASRKRIAPCPVCDVPLGASEASCSSCGLRLVHRPAPEEQPKPPARADVLAGVPSGPEGAGLPSPLSQKPAVPDLKRFPTRTPASQGLTNGLVLERTLPRPAGRTNGLAGGRTNGLTNGIGRTNGLNGPSASPIHEHRFRERRVSPKTAWKLCLIPLVAAIILLVQLVYVPEYEGENLPIQIDGLFDDWASVPRFLASTSPLADPNTDIVQVALVDNVYFLSFYIEVSGTALLGDSFGDRLTDAFFVFLDVDRSPSTGYRVQGLGADRLLQVNGWGGQVVSAVLLEFDGNRDPYDWGGWFKPASAMAAASENRVELQAKWDGIVDPKAPIEAAFASQSWDGRQDASEIVATSLTPYVRVSQDTAAPSFVSGALTPIARITFAAVGGDVAIASVNVTLDGTFTASTLGSVSLVDGMGTVLAQTAAAPGPVMFSLSSLVVPESGSETLSVVPEVLLGDGTTIGAFVPRTRDVVPVAAGVVFAGSPSAPESRAYAGTSPVLPAIDGGFQDWPNGSADPVGDAPNAIEDIDISRYAFQGSAGDVLFLIETAGKVLNGTLVPARNPLYTGGVPSQPDLDRDGVPDAVDPLPTDFNNDGTPDASTNGDYDGDGITDYGFAGGTDFWLNTTIPITFPAPYAGRPVSVFIGPVERPVSRGEDRARFYLDADGSSATGYAAGGLGADYLVEVTGKAGVIFASSAARFNGSDPGQWAWDSLGPSPAMSDRARLEAALAGVSIGNASRAFFETTAWGNLRDDTVPAPPAAAPAASALPNESPANPSPSAGDRVRTLDISGNLKWFFTNGATTGTGCATNLAASTSAGALATSSTLTSASASICWFTPTKPQDTIAGPWEVILDVERVTNGTKILSPDANGDSNAWTATGCPQANSWQCVDEAPNDGDTTYLVSNAASADSLFNVLDWTSAPVPPSPLSVISVVAEASCRKTTNPVVDVRIIIKSGGTVYAGATAQDCANSATYTIWTQTWTTDPADGLPWTLADLNALQVGVRDNDGTAREVRASHLRATINWIPVYSVQIDKCTNVACTSFTTLYGPTNGNTYGNDVAFTTPSIPAQTFSGNDRLRFMVTLYVSGATTPGSVRIRYNGPYPGTDDSRATVALPEFEEIAVPAVALALGVPYLRRRARRRRRTPSQDPRRRPEDAG